MIFGFSFSDAPVHILVNSIVFEERALSAYSFDNAWALWMPRGKACNASVFLWLNSSNSSPPGSKLPPFSFLHHWQAPPRAPVIATGNSDGIAALILGSCCSNDSAW